MPGLIFDAGNLQARGVFWLELWRQLLPNFIG
jgi:hypothetical protein